MDNQATSEFNDYQKDKNKSPEIPRGFYSMFNARIFYR